VLLDPRTRILTLVGPGGIGKTRLALAVADSLAAELVGQVWFIDLSAITDSSLVLRTIALQLGIRDTGERSVDDRLQEHLADSRAVLVLDNMEQVQLAGAELAGLLAVCPGVRLLVTSREPLHLRVEQRFDVQPLAQSDAVALFVERARRLGANLRLTADNSDTVTRLCEQLDRLPLAIELAASRIKLLSPRAILERFGLDMLRSREHDRAARHQSLRVTMAWSYALLSTEEQAVFRRLGVFVGGCTLEAATAVCMGDYVLDALESLVDKSLLRSEPDTAGGMRLKMLETIRAFALEQLTASGEVDEVRARCAAYFVQFVGPLSEDPDLPTVEWLDNMAAEHDNIRAVLRWSLDSGDGATALTIASAVHRFWWTRGYLSEGLQWLEEALAHADTVMNSSHVAWAHHAAGGLAWRQADYARAEMHYQAHLDARRRQGDPLHIAIALQGLASVARDRGDAHRSVELWEECLTVFRAVDNRPRIARATLNLAVAVLANGDPERADRLLDEAVVLATKIGQYWALATSLAYRALIASDVHADVRRAAGFIKAGLGLEEQVTDVWVTAHLLELSGWVNAQIGGESAAVVQLLGASAAMRDRMGGRLHPAFVSGHERHLAVLRARLSPDGFATAWAAGRQLPTGELVPLAEAIVRSAATWSPAQAVPDNRFRRGLLTEREREIVVLVAQGLTSPEIADLLVVGERTVETHIDHVRAKLGVRSRAQIAAWAVDQGLARPHRP
jgi:predicted ATPase/DNA-binding CsgD family transcriptional regulator